MSKTQTQTQTQTQTVDLSRQEIEEALAQARTALPEKTFGILEKVVRAYLWLVGVLEKKRATIGRLRRMLFGPKTEKTPPGKGPDRGACKPSPSAKRKRSKRPGHGRNGAAQYTGAKKVCVAHETLKPGDRCPGCGKGKVYEQPEPGILVRVRGQPPLAATIYELQKLRCNLCGEIFTARPPDGAGGGLQKYDATCAAMIALLKYGSGFPFHRLGRLQGPLGVPLPPATQWKIVSGAARTIEPVLQELIGQAAQGKVVHNDDTAMRILMWMGRRREESQRRQEEQAREAAAAGRTSPAQSRKCERMGIFTSGILSVTRTGPHERRAALFFTGRKHAGENLAGVLARRTSGLSPPIQMCDALSRNVPASRSGELATILANCLAHGRRQFVDVTEAFPKECGRILKILQRVYLHDAVTRKRKMTAMQRLRFHQDRSGPLMAKLHAWMSEQIRQKRVEPNSGLGEAIGYMLKHWDKLTLFLRRSAAPLDNNIVERALKKAILHRKNALFYKTDNGAGVGDLFMSLIHTCELNGADPFDYLTQLMRYARLASANPKDWLPWNYRKAVRRCRAA